LMNGGEIQLMNASLETGFLLTYPLSKKKLYLVQRLCIYVHQQTHMV